MEKDNLKNYIINFEQVKSIVANWFAQERINNGLSQHELAELLYVTPQTVSAWERGKSFPDIELFSQFCLVLGIDLEELIIEGDSFFIESIVDQVVYPTLHMLITDILECQIYHTYLEETYSEIPLEDLESATI